MVFTLKPIHPKRLDLTEARVKLRDGLERVGYRLQKDYALTVQNWQPENTPDFKVHTSVIKGTDGIMVEVVPEGDPHAVEIYGYVNKGTEPHEIWAGYYTGKSEHKVLAFASASTPKTRPGSLNSGSGSKGAVDTFVPFVQHPGSEARDFDGQIIKKEKAWIKTELQKAMKEAAKATGHGK
jgi:hypothetical protein